MDHSQPHPEFYKLPFTFDSFNGMPYLRLGQSGLRVSRIGLGTWKFGLPETNDGSRVDQLTACAILDRAVEEGVTFWDTANRYNESSGNSERVIGHWLDQNPDQRRNVVIATKMFGGMDGKTPNHCGLSRGNIIESAYASLERMGLDCLDLLYFHAFDPETPIEESLAAVEDLIRQDLVRYFAVSNFTVDQLKRYREVEAQTSIRVRVTAVQNKFDILHGEGKQPGVLDFCRDSGISLVPYSPLARGLLTSRYLDPKATGPGDRLVDEGTLDKDADAATMDRVRALADLAKKWDLQLSELVLAYTLTLPGMGPPIPAASTVDQVISNAKAGKIELSGEQRTQIRQAIAA